MINTVTRFKQCHDSGTRKQNRMNLLTDLYKIFKYS